VTTHSIQTIRETKEVALVKGTMSPPRGRSLRLAAALAVVAAAALTAGVGVTDAKTQATVTLKFIAQSTGQGGNGPMSAVIANFEKAYPDLRERPADAPAVG
jgi:hypothetical protein